MFTQYQKVRDRRAAGENGFTLIELLIVIVVLAILAAIVIFGLSGITGQSATSACKADVKSVETAQETFKSTPGNNGAYAASVTALTALGPNGPYLRQIPGSGHYSVFTDATGTVYLYPANTTDPGTGNYAVQNNYDGRLNGTVTGFSKQDLCAGTPAGMVS